MHLRVHSSLKWNSESVVLKKNGQGWKALSVGSKQVQQISHKNQYRSKKNNEDRNLEKIQSKGGKKVRFDRSCQNGKLQGWELVGLESRRTACENRRCFGNFIGCLLDTQFAIVVVVTEVCQHIWIQSESPRTDTLVDPPRRRLSLSLSPSGCWMCEIRGYEIWRWPRVAVRPS